MARKLRLSRRYSYILRFSLLVVNRVRIKEKQKKKEVEDGDGGFVQGSQSQLVAIVVY